jgi:hypothetical protein
MCGGLGRLPKKSPAAMAGSSIDRSAQCSGRIVTPPSWRSWTTQPARLATPIANAARIIASLAVLTIMSCLPSSPVAMFMAPAMFMAFFDEAGRQAARHADCETEEQGNSEFSHERLQALLL